MVQQPQEIVSLQFAVNTSMSKSEGPTWAQAASEIEPVKRLWSRVNLSKRLNRNSELGQGCCVSISHFQHKLTQVQKIVKSCGDWTGKIVVIQNNAASTICKKGKVFG